MDLNQEHTLFSNIEINIEILKYMKGYRNEGLKRKYEVRTKDRNRTKL